MACKTFFFQLDPPFFFMHLISNEFPVSPISMRVGTWIRPRQKQLIQAKCLNGKETNFLGMHQMFDFDPFPIRRQKDPHRASREGKRK